MIGANDIYFGRHVHANQVAEKLELAISRLRDAGAYAFVLGVPYSLALTPNGVASPDPAFDRFAADLRREIGKLRVRLSSRQYKLKVAVLDVGAITSRVASDPERYGFDARLAEQACLMGPYGGTRSLCDMPEPYMWWDEVRDRVRCQSDLAVPSDATAARGVRARRGDDHQTATDLARLGVVRLVIRAFRNGRSRIEAIDGSVTLLACTSTSTSTPALARGLDPPTAACRFLAS